MGMRRLLECVESRQSSMRGGEQMTEQKTCDCCGEPCEEEHDCQECSESVCFRCMCSEKIGICIDCEASQEERSTFPEEFEP